MLDICCQIWYNNNRCREHTTEGQQNSQAIFLNETVVKLLSKGLLKSVKP